MAELPKRTIARKSKDPQTKEEKKLMFGQTRCHIIGVCVVGIPIFGNTYLGNKCLKFVSLVYKMTGNVDEIQGIRVTLSEIRNSSLAYSCEFLQYK